MGRIRSVLRSKTKRFKRLGQRCLKGFQLLTTFVNADPKRRSSFKVWKSPDSNQVDIECRMSLCSLTRSFKDGLELSGIQIAQKRQGEMVLFLSGPSDFAAVMLNRLQALFNGGFKFRLNCHGDKSANILHRGFRKRQRRSDISNLLASVGVGGCQLLRMRLREFAEHGSDESFDADDLGLT